MKFTNRFSTIAVLAIALLLIIFTTASASENQPSRNLRTKNQVSKQTNHLEISSIPQVSATTAFAFRLESKRYEDTSSLIPSRRVFQPTRYATIHAPNFGTPIRRAPIRRKGRTQH